jgi:hypothetical protein
LTSARGFTGFLDPGDPRWVEALGRVRHDFFHTPAYVGACAAHEAGEPMLFLLDDGPDGMLVPLVRHSLRPFGEVYRDFSDVRSPYGYASPLYWGCRDGDRLAELQGTFEARLRDLGVVTLFLRLHPYLEAHGPGLSALGGVRTHGPVVYLDLRDPEGSWNGINPQNRRFIKGMLAAGCTVRFDDWDTFGPVVEAYYGTMARLEAASFYFFRREFFLRLREADPARFHLATAFSPDGAVAGGMFFTATDGLVHTFLSGVVEGFGRLSPAKLLNNAVRLWGLDHGCHTLNLGGGLGSRADSLFQFKVRFSKRTRDYATFRRILLPEVCRALAGEPRPGREEYFPPYRRPVGRMADPAV